MPALQYTVQLRLGLYAIVAIAPWRYVRFDREAKVPVSVVCLIMQRLSRNINRKTGGVSPCPSAWTAAKGEAAQLAPKLGLPNVAKYDQLVADLEKAAK